jgi:hypothetical protein
MNRAEMLGNLMFDQSGIVAENGRSLSTADSRHDTLDRLIYE